MAYYHRFRTHLSLAMDCPEPRPYSSPDRGRVIAVPKLGGFIITMSGRLHEWPGSELADFEVLRVIGTHRMRRTRYRGIKKKTHLHHIAIATAINLQRGIDWLWEVPRSKTYTSHFARLALTA